MKDSDKVGTRIVLVHGTWGKKSDWTFPGSAIWDRLRDEFPDAEITRFEWSDHHNRHVARMEAAADLKLRVSEGATKTVLIGHSHGGNVVERVLLEKGNIEGSEIDDGRLRGITVGTPFLRFEPPWASAGVVVPALDWGRLGALLVGIGLGAALLIGQLRFGLQPQLSGGEFERAVALNDFSKQLAVTTLFALAVFLIPLIGLLIFFLIGSRSGAPVESAPFDTGLRFIPQLSAIRTKRDEAALSLLAGRLLGNMVNVSRRAGFAVAGGPLLIGLFAVLLAVDDQENHGWASAVERAIYGVDGFIAYLTGWSNTAQLVTAAFAAIVTLAAVGLFMTTLAVMEAILCGSDGLPFLRSGRVRIVGNPHGDREQVIVELTSREFGLRHSRLMSDPASIDAIVTATREWLDE